MTKAQTTHALRLIDDELRAVTGALTAERSHEIDRLVEVLSIAKRIFVTGQGEAPQVFGRSYAGCGSRVRAA